MLNLHLVFDLSITIPLTDALKAHGYHITGSDVTLEQFAIAAAAGHVDAEIAIVDGGLGIVRKQDCVRLLKDVRMRMPDLRLIVILPEVDSEWQKSLGIYGIYDVYAAEQFSVEDIQKWIQTKKTLADIPNFHTELPPEITGEKVGNKIGFLSEKKYKGRIQAFLTDWTKGLRTTPIKKQSSKEQEMPKELVEETREQELPEVGEEAAYTEPTRQADSPPIPHVLQPYIVAVGSLMKRSGNTHTALQIAYETASKGFSTAFVEYRSEPRPSDIVSFATGFDGLKFQRQGIDFFPNRSPFDVAEIYTLGYEAVILDLGVLVDEAEERLVLNSAAQEFLRSQFQFITLSAAPWDLHYLVQHSNSVQVLMRKSSVVVNYADEEMMKEFREMFPAVPSVLNPLQANPFTVSAELAYWLDQPKEKKKRWFH